MEIASRDRTWLKMLADEFEHHVKIKCDERSMVQEGSRQIYITVALAKDIVANLRRITKVKKDKIRQIAQNVDYEKRQTVAD